MEKPQSPDTPQFLRDLPYKTDIQSLGLVLNPDIEIYGFKNEKLSPMLAYRIPVGTWMLVQCTPIL